jgi:hypothetical protein
MATPIPDFLMNLALDMDGDERRRFIAKFEAIPERTPLDDSFLMAMRLVDWTDELLSDFDGEDEG